MDYFILGVLVVLIVIMCVDLWDALQADWDAEVDQGQCAGQCRGQPCPHPWNCSKGVQS